MSVVVDQLLERARAETGLSDFGAGDWHEGLCRLVEAVEKDVGEDGGSMDRIESLLVARLCRRLRIEDWYAGHGAEARDAVYGPFVIFGLPRTGTTALHHMLSLDARFRYLRRWEVEAPVPPPDLATERSDVRRQQRAVQADSQHIRRIDGPVEDGAIFEMCFHHSEMVLPVPSYTTWWRTTDHRDALAYHERILRLLHSHRPPHHWLLKFPNYLFMLPQLASHYPGARFVMTHRDPVASVSSTCSVVLASRLRRLPSAKFDPHAIGPEILEHFLDGVHRALLARRVLGEHLFVDVGQRALEADPLGIAERVYDHAVWTSTNWCAMPSACGRRRINQAHEVTMFTSRRISDSRPRRFAMRSPNTSTPSRTTCDEATSASVRPRRAERRTPGSSDSSRNRLCMTHPSPARGST